MNEQKEDRQRFMQTIENERREGQEKPQEAMPTKREVIGGTTYIINSYISPNATETMEDKIMRMMKLDIEDGNY